jgi:hypothetical protein
VIINWQQENKTDDVQSLVEVENGGNKKGANVVHEEYTVIGSFPSS